MSTVLKDKHSNNCLRLDYTFYTTTLEGLGLLKDLSIPWIHPSFCISPPPGSPLPYLLNTYHHLTSLSILLGPRVDILKGPGCQTALPRDCATYIPINGEGMSISPHSHQCGEVVFANFIDGDTFQLVLQRYLFNKQIYSMRIATHTLKHSQAHLITQGF